MEQWELDLAKALAKPTVADGADADEDSIEAQQDRMFSKLERVADILADSGVIHNTPYSKRQWVDRSLVG